MSEKQISRFELSCYAHGICNIFLIRRGAKEAKPGLQKEGKINFGNFWDRKVDIKVDSDKQINVM